MEGEGAGKGWSCRGLRGQCRAAAGAAALSQIPTTFLKTTPLTPTTSCPRPTLDLESEEKHAFTSAGTNQLEQRPRPGPPGRLSRGVGRTCHKMIEKENVVLEAGNWLLDGGTHPSLPAASLGPSVRTRTLQEQNMLHEVEGHVPQAPSPAATQQRTWAPTGSTKDAGNLGSMSRLGRFVALGVAPVQHPSPPGACGRPHQLQHGPKQ